MHQYDFKLHKAAFCCDPKVTACQVRIVYFSGAAARQWGGRNLWPHWLAKE